MEVRPVEERGTQHNLNDCATVKLNSDGMWLMIQEYGTDYLDMCHPDWQRGTVQMMLWEVCRVFGERMVMGFSPVIETNFHLRRG